ncbi:MAG: polymer-forming cytoskeletal protein, partial [Candidatus Aminicenantes bacterium]|nr:polymer-forming cytoskeletal protein [Candidatus Aminicenantes bacterium]
HGVFLDWIYMIKDRKPKLWRNLPNWTVVAGEYKGDITAKRVFLLGTCTKVNGKITARRTIRIRGCPPKHKTLVLWLFLKAGILNPMFRLDLIIDGYFFLFLSWVRRLARGRL